MKEIIIGKMGSCVGKSSGLSKEAKNLAIEIFKIIDTDGNSFIDFNEALKFWQSQFAKISSRAMFGAVDKDKNQKIDLDEWISFWTRVKKSGHSDEDIMEELNNLKNKGPWTNFVGVKPFNPLKID